ncbi:ankyrin repeat domain-containing protein [Dyella nitratireducens]
MAWLMLAMMLLLTACDMPAPQSNYNVVAFFKDPKAQALAIAAEHGNAAVVQRLMKQEHVNPDVIFSEDAYDSGMPLLAWPIFTQNPEGLQAMLENGANPNVKLSYQTRDRGMRYHGNAMVWAAKQDDPVYLKLLLDHGGDPDTRNANDETLLFQAFIWHNQWQNVQLLVERGADINALSQGVPIILNYAALGGFQQTYWLLQHGADPTLQHLVKQPPPPAPPINPVIESIFWHPGNPSNPTWQRMCQQWLLQHGYERPPMPDHMREMRKNLGFPYEEKDIPLL